jgi:ribonuclease HII
MTFPNLETELELIADKGSLICLDEVGRGAIAGPVVVAATVFTQHSAPEIPKGLKDSKLIAEPKREAIAELAADWLENAVGEVSASEIDQLGISEALKRAALMAIDKLSVTDVPILLDGKHNWLGMEDLVITKIKADQQCAAVSAASIIAKHYRDEIMRELDSLHPNYQWSGNKGYASEAHMDAIREFGSTKIHRKTWLNRIINSEQMLF